MGRSTSKGPYIYDLDGNRIVDFALGYGPMILGHNHPEVVKAVKAQVGKGTMYGASPDLAIEYVRMVQKAMPSIEMLSASRAVTATPPSRQVVGMMLVSTGLRSTP